MILGLSIEPGHECTCSTEEEVHLSLASIESRSYCGEAAGYSQLMLKTANSEQLLCTFVHGVIFQQCLDLKLMPGEKVTFTVQGSYRVYVTGYSRNSDSNPLVPASDEPTVEQEDTDGDADNIDNTVVKSEPDDSEYFNGVNRDVEMSNENEELNDGQEDESSTQIKSEPEDNDSKDCSWDEKMTNSSQSGAADGCQEDEDFVVSEESVTSKNLHEVAGASTGAPVILTEEEVFQKTHLVEVNVTEDGIEGSIDNIDCTACSKPASLATMTLEIMGLSEQEEIKENNLIGVMVGNNIDSNSNNKSLLRQDHVLGVSESDKGQLFNEEGTPVPVELNGQNESNLDSSSSTDISAILPCEPPNVTEIQEAASLHETWEDKTTSDSARNEIIGTQGQQKQEAVPTGYKVFLCKHCVKSFSTALDLEVHEHSHSNEESFPCKQCGKVLLGKESLLKHEMMHKEEKPFVCKYCEKKFTIRSTLWQHKKLHIVGNPFHCNDCEKKFLNRQALKEHEKVHAREKALNRQTAFRCKYCKKKFGDKADWLEHEQTHTSKKLHKCRHCQKKFIHQRALSLHEKMHTGPRNFKCSHCEKTFSRNRDLANHEMVHTGEKPFQCNQCEKGFNRSSTLKSHMKIHSGEKSFQCYHCGMAFRHKFTLVHHERIHTKTKPYNCKYCNKTFNAKSSLKYHEWVHSEEKPFQCNHCDKAFSRKNILARHERIHTGEKPYECKECEKRFNQRVALIQHQRVHTGDMPYKCKYCDKEFAWKSNYLNHERIHTREGAS